MDKILVTAPHHYRVQQVLGSSRSCCTRKPSTTRAPSDLKTLWVTARTRNPPSPGLATLQLHLLYGCKAKLYLGLGTMPEGISE